MDIFETSQYAMIYVVFGWRLSARQDVWVSCPDNDIYGDVLVKHN